MAGAALLYKCPGGDSNVLIPTTVAKAGIAISCASLCILCISHTQIQNTLTLLIFVTAVVASLLFRHYNKRKPDAACDSQQANANECQHKQAADACSQTTLTHLIQIQAELSRKRPKYVSHFKRHKASVKVPGNVEPESLAPDALPHLASLLQSRDVDVLQATIRSGCILLTLDLCSLRLHSQQLGQQPRQLTSEEPGTQQQANVEQLLVKALDQWLCDAGLSTSVPLKEAVVLQVGSKSWHARKATAPSSSAQQPMQHTWELQAVEAPLLPSSCAITPAAAVCVLPPAMEATTNADTVPESGGGGTNSSAGCVCVEVPVLISLPDGVRLEGWTAESKGTQQQTDAQKQEQHNTPTTVTLLASVCGTYLTTHVVTQPSVSSLSSPSQAQVQVWVPAGLAVHTRPSPLNIELWLQDGLLASTTTLLLPPSLPGVAAELGRLPVRHLSEGSCQVTDYMRDLGNWLHHNYHTPLTTAHSPSHKPAIASSAVGVKLLQQSVLWGMPDLSTLLVDTLMMAQASSTTGSHTQPPISFTQLAHASHTTSQHLTAGTAGAEGSNSTPTNDLGGLLHLALLAVDASCLSSRDMTLAEQVESAGCPERMLRAVLCWGRVHGGKESGFAWRWDEPNALGFTPLQILASLPRVGEVRAMCAQLCGGNTANAGAWGIPPVLLEGAPSHASAPSQPVSALCQAMGRMRTRILASLLSSQALYMRSLPPQLTPPDLSQPNAADSTASSDATAVEGYAAASVESGFQAWVHEQSAPVLKGWCTCMAANVIVSLVRATLAGRLMLELPTEAIMGIPYTATAVALRACSLGSNKEAKLQALVVLILLSRSLVVSAIGLHIVAWPASFRLLLNLRVEVVLEVLVAPMFEKVRIPALLVMRSLLVMGYSIYYRRAQFVSPWLQAAAVHLSSVIVAVAMDIRWRHLYVVSSLRPQQQQLQGLAATLPQTKKKQ